MRPTPLAFAVIAATAIAADAPPIDFDRDVRPILSEHCFACHGPDAAKRKAGLRLDTRVGTFARLDDHFAVAPGKPAESSLVERLGSDDPEEMMPPPKERTRKGFTPAMAETLRRWVAEGAPYRGHWAYERPRPGRPGETIDRLVRDKLGEVGLSPSAEADRATLIRRLSFDLRGLPPAPWEVDSFAADNSADAYPRLVDRLLASPHYGETMALGWLDLVRFADTGGYHSDNHRDVTPYRDYVIAAFNANKPFDRFTIEQLAGDLLPAPTEEQQIASGYNRILMTTEEGGAQAKEYIAKYAADRVRNASSVWLAATLGCAECHDHKYDPYTARDFYRFAAFFADIQEAAVGRQQEARVLTAAERARVAAIDAELARCREALSAASPAIAAEQAKWERAFLAETGGWSPLVPTSATAESGAAMAIEPDGTVGLVGEAAATDVYTLTFDRERPAITGLRLEALPDPKAPQGGPGRDPSGNFLLHEFQASLDGRPVAFGEATATYSQPRRPPTSAIDGDSRTGWAVAGRQGRASFAVFEAKGDIPAGKGRLTVRLDQHFGTRNVLGRFRISATSAPRPVRAGGVESLPPFAADALVIEPSKRTKDGAEALAAYYRTIAPSLAGAREAIDDLTREREAIVNGATTSLITTAGPPKVVRILHRGNWQDETGEVVTPAVPARLGPEVVGRRASRLDLANWLVSAENPLTARVFVNRTWKALFGRGLVASLEDFGSQGESPSHPELLDALAVEFRESGWDVKRLVRRIVLSETYKQASSASAKAREADPSNRWLARQGRFRLDAELVRDDMLWISGLFSPHLGGKSIKPYQPAGYWDHLNFPRRTYENDHGEALYRRAIYTYWQRTFVHPSLLAFDAPGREECTAQRPRSNTPLQALVLLNDPIFVEGARAFAEKLIRGVEGDDRRVLVAYRLALSRPPRPEETAILIDLLAKHRAYYRIHGDEATRLAHVGEHKVAGGVDPVELAAWTSVTRAILNLHETITRY